MAYQRNPRIRILSLFQILYFCLIGLSFHDRRLCIIAFVLPLSRKSVTTSVQSSHQTPFVPQSSLSKTLFAKQPKKLIDQRWYPDVTSEIEEECLSLTADLILNRLLTLSSSSSSSFTSSDFSIPQSPTPAYQLAISGKFSDLAQSEIGIRRLEFLFADESTRFWSEEIVLGSIYLLQSLCIMGMLVGVKGSPEQHERRVQHLKNPNWDMHIPTNLRNRSIAELKFRCDQIPGTHLLAKLGRKRTTQGAMDLLIDLTIWTPHEDLGLLRSGFPIHFTPHELQMTKETLRNNNTHVNNDMDDQWNIRQDLTHLKIYTIDSASTTEVDDGISLQVLEPGRYRYWIHIADADRWAPRGSDIFRIAQARTTTHYLPTGPIPMFPPILSTDVMSLRPNTDTCALSLAVELNDDGSIQKDSIQVMTSKIQIQYRLTYDDVDEMLQEGVAYREEWELGELFRAANQRRSYRIRNGSTEGFIPHSIPHSFVSLFDDNDESDDGLGIRLTIDSSHNQGRNRTTESTVSMNTNVQSVSDSNVLVTEMMILAGEALGQWKLRSDREDAASTKVNDESWQTRLPPWTLPFRGQATPQWEKRAQETQILHDLKRKQEEEEQEQQHQQYQQQQQQVHLYPKFGYCHAWYARRFLSPVSIGPKPTSHFGLGVKCYIQWTSPIRRLGDLQVHAAVKRYIRRRHILQLYREGKCLPENIRFVDIGCSLPALLSAATTTRTEDAEEKKDDDDDKDNNLTFQLDSDIDFNFGKSLVAASKSVQRQSQQYWLFEYIRRLIQRQEDDDTLPSIQLDGIVLGCVDPDRLQYAIYLPDIGYEHRYVSQKGFLQVGEVLKLEVESVHPRMGLLTLSLINVG